MMFWNKESETLSLLAAINVSACFSSDNMSVVGPGVRKNLVFSIKRNRLTVSGLRRCIFLHVIE